MVSIKSFFVVIFLLLACHGNGQQKDTIARDVVIAPKSQNDTVSSRETRAGQLIPNQPTLSDTETLLNQSAAGRDILPIDTTAPGQPDSAELAIPLHPIDSLTATGRALRNNRWINTTAAPVLFVSTEKHLPGKEIFFYAMCALLLLLGLFKTFYSHYFSNIFRVYFNTSLRQSQLSEQLLQARLPSFLLNIFFIIIAGIFVWLLFRYRVGAAIEQPFLLLQICIAAVAGIYLIKFCFLKFIGWVSGITAATDYYIFIIFLVNKILALVLLPFLILLAFGNEAWFSIVERLAILSVGALLVSRYVKSFALAGNKLSVKPFHFLLFIAGAEIIPVLLMYKVAVDYFLK